MTNRDRKIENEITSKMDKKTYFLHVLDRAVKLLEEIPVLSIEECEEIIKAKNEGFAGVMRDEACIHGFRLVDRRRFPDAIPMEEDVLEGIPKPQKL